MKVEDKLLLQKFLEGQCSEKELAQVKQLLEQPGAHELLDELITLQSGVQWNTAFEPDQELADLTARKKAAAAELFKANGHYKQQDTGKSRSPVRLMFLRYAAVWAGIIIIGTLALWQNRDLWKKGEQIVYVEQVNPNGLPIRYVLPDSSEVFLGAGSSLRYPQSFKDATREIELHGEAFFQVTRNPEKPFIIHTENIQTRVLGTSFKVEAFANAPIVVSVATGKVGVSQHTDKINNMLALLTPGRQVTWDRQRQTASERDIDVSVLENWKAGDLSFEEQPVSVVAEELQRRFDVKIEFIAKEVASNKVSVVFPATKPIGNMMHILSETGRFSYKTTDNKVFKIYKK